MMLFQILLMLASAAQPRAAESTFPLRVEAVSTSKGLTTIAAHPYLPPTLAFDVADTDSKPIFAGAVLNCSQDVEQKVFGDHADNFVILACEDGRKLKLKGIHFDR